MDPRIDELLQITKDTNYMVHKMRRSQMWGRFFTVVVWFVVIFGPIIAYYAYFQKYVQPYMGQIQQFQQQLQSASQQLQSANKQTQNYQSEISSFFGNFMAHSTTTAPSK